MNAAPRQPKRSDIAAWNPGGRRAFGLRVATACAWSRRMSDSDRKAPACCDGALPARSRREVFRLLTAAAIGGSAISFASIAEAQSKTDKKTAKYQDHPNKGQSCSQCNFYRPPKSCQLVDGDISPGGWCSFCAKNGA